MSDINTPMDVIVCPQCSLPKLTGVYGYAGPQCQCWPPTPQPTFYVVGTTLLQQSEEIRRLRAELAASREREARMREAGQRLLDAIEHDTQIHRFSILWDGLRAALAEGAQ